MDSIIFDLDGTLWDATDVALIAWNEVMRKHKNIRNDIAREDLEGIMGLQLKEAGQKLLPGVDKETQQKVLQECSTAECYHLTDKGGKLYDGVEETLTALGQRYKLFIVSNCQSGYIEAFFNYHKLNHYFLDYENPGRTGLSKGENIKLIIERNGLSHPIYVGDTESDLKAARFAKIPFVYASYGFGKVSEYDYIIRAFSDLQRY